MNDDLRVSDADRNRAASLLHVHFAAGRLTVGELHDRLGVVVGAVTAGDLRRALDALPGTVTVAQQDRRLEDGRVPAAAGHLPAPVPPGARGGNAGGVADRGGAGPDPAGAG